MLRRYVGMLLMLAAIPSMPQNAQPIDGANAVLADSSLDNMVGHWKMSGKTMGKPAAHQQWHWQMTQKNAAGQWTPFADVTLSRSR